MKLIFLRKPYMSLSNAWWKKYVFDYFEAFLYGCRPCNCGWSKYTTHSDANANNLYSFKKYYKILQMLACFANMPVYKINYSIKASPSLNYFTLQPGHLKLWLIAHFWKFIVDIGCSLLFLKQTSLLLGFKYGTSLDFEW